MMFKLLGSLWSDRVLETYMGRIALPPARRGHIRASIGVRLARTQQTTENTEVNNGRR
jgi:hypothetical protein